MGLDMSLYGEKFFWSNYEKPELDRTEDDLRVKSLEVELGYWRKHPDLHGYIVQTFADGKDDCQRIDLNVEALRKIIGAVMNKSLPKTSGFFFGASDGTETEETLQTLMHAIKWLETKEDGVSRSVYYQASW